MITDQQSDVKWSVITDQKINWQIHALARMLERGISREEVKEAILYGEIIEELESF